MRLEQEAAVVSFLSRSDDVTLSSSAKLQLVTGWTPHMSGKGGEVHKGKEGETGEGKCA